MLLLACAFRGNEEPEMTALNSCDTRTYKVYDTAEKVYKCMLYSFNCINNQRPLRDAMFLNSFNAYSTRVVGKVTFSKYRAPQMGTASPP